MDSVFSHVAKDEPIAELRPSNGRHVFGLVMITALGLLLVWLGFVGPDFSWMGRLMVLVPGAAFLFLAQAMYRAGRHGVVLTRETLSDTSGKVICHVADIREVDRGFFAIRPSNGFLVRLENSGPRAWHPGLWWRIGPYIGVGGITASADGKAMADFLSLLVAERKRPADTEASSD